MPNTKTEIIVPTGCTAETLMKHVTNEVLHGEGDVAAVSGNLDTGQPFGVIVCRGYNNVAMLMYMLEKLMEVQNAENAQNTTEEGNKEACKADADIKEI